ncbi:hypothetical protein TrST_g2795 [Triparma strigata]|uniref:Uncharacterized protein n=1 Tax=Triparma strigata TaxID=1606541 RepID=A0A9W7BXF3_9STRA|nr:hypothetical protein TrST_g2795 [Triparma strigata]
MPSSAHTERSSWETIESSHTPGSVVFELEAGTRSPSTTNNPIRGGSRRQDAATSMSRYEADSKRIEEPKTACGGCCSCCCYTCFHQNKKVRYFARFCFLVGFVYFCYSMTVVWDLLKLLKCEKASCDDWCVQLDGARIVDLGREDNHLDFITEATFRYPSKTMVGMGETVLKINYDGKTMMEMTSSPPSFTYEDTGEVTNYLRHGTSKMYVNASGELGNLDLGAELFGKLMSESEIELEIEVKATVTTWAFSYFPITITTPSRKEPYSCRQINGTSTVCAVGKLNEFEQDDCVKEGEFPIIDPDIHSIEFVNSTEPNSIKLISNFTVAHGSTMDLFADLPTVTIDAFTTNSDNPYSESQRLPSNEVSSARVSCHDGRMHGKWVTGIVEIEIVGSDERIKVLQDVVSLLLDGEDYPEVLLYIQGASDTGNLAFFQRILALMPTIKMLDYENVNINHVASSFNLSEAVALQSVSLKGLSEDEDMNMDVAISTVMDIDIPYNTYGTTPSISVDLLDPDDETNVLLVGIMDSVTFYGEDSPAKGEFRFTILDISRMIDIAADGKIADVKVTGSSSSDLLLSQALSEESLEITPVIEGMVGNNATIDLNSFDVNATLTFDESQELGFKTLFGGNISSLPVTFDIEVGEMNLTIISENSGLDENSKGLPFLYLETPSINCKKHEFCALSAELTIKSAATRSLLEDYINGVDSSVGGYGTINGHDMINLEKLALPGIPTSISFSNLTNLIDDDCDALSGLCIGDGFIKIDSFNVLGATVTGGDIDMPCVFAEGLCPLMTPADIQALDPTTGGMAINVTVDFDAFDEYAPFLNTVLIKLPKISLGVDLATQEESLTVEMEAFDLKNDKKFNQIIFFGGAVTDWSAVFRMIYTFQDSGAELTVHGLSSVGESSVSSAIPAIKIEIDQNSDDFNFVFPDVPMPYTDVDNDSTAMPWALVSTTATEAKFQINFDFDNPVPVAIRMNKVNGKVLFKNPNSNQDVMIASISLPNDEFILKTGNNSLVSYLILHADEGVATCQKPECNDLSNPTEQSQLECIPCTAPIFLKTFLANEATEITVELNFENMMGEMVKLVVPLTLYDDSYENQVAKGRDKDFIDKVVDVESILARAIFFELDFSSTLYAIITNAISNVLGKIDGVLDITVDNIFSFSFTQSKLYIGRVGMSDIDGVPETMPLSNVWWPPFFEGTFPADDDFEACVDVDSDKSTYIPSGVVSETIPIDIKGSKEALMRAIAELYVQGRFCLHMTEGVVDMSFKCENNLLTHLGKTCEQSEDFGLTMPWKMGNVGLYRKEACHVPDDCIPDSNPDFSVDGDQGQFSADKFVTTGSATVASDKLKLSDYSAGAWGSAFYKEKVKVRDSFEATFKFKFKKPSCGGLFESSCPDFYSAFAFVIQNTKEDAMGNTDQCTADLSTEGIQQLDGTLIMDTKTHVSCGGYKGIDKSVGVVFSNTISQLYNFPSIADSLKDNERTSISVWKNGNVADGTGSSMRAAENVISYIQPGEAQAVDNGNEHTVRVVYNSFWRQLYIYYDDASTVFLNAPIDLSSLDLDSDGEAWLGFTSQMTTKAQVEITQIGFNKAKMDETKFLIAEEGQIRSSPGKKGVFRVDARDSCNLPRREGGEVFGVWLRDSGGVEVQINTDDIEDTGDGLYTCTYTAEASGVYEVLVGGSKHVAGTIVVK